MKPKTRFVLLIFIVFHSSRLAAQGPFLAGAYAGGQVPLTVEGESRDATSAAAWGVFGQARLSPSVAAEIRAGYLSYSLTDGAGPNYDEYDLKVVPISLGFKFFLSPRSRSPFFLSAGIIAAPGTQTKTSYRRPFGTHPSAPSVTEQSVTAFGGYAGLGVDTSLGRDWIVVLELQGLGLSGDAGTAFLRATVAIAYRFGKKGGPPAGGLRYPG